MNKRYSMSMLISHTVYVNNKYRGCLYAYPEWASDKDRLFKEAKRQFLDAVEQMASEISFKQNGRCITIKVSEPKKIIKYEVVFNLKYQGIVEGLEDTTDEFLIRDAKDTYLTAAEFDRDKLSGNISSSVCHKLNKIFLWDKDATLGLQKPQKGLYAVFYNGKAVGEMAFDPKDGGAAELYRKAKNNFLPPNDIKFHSIETYFNGFKLYMINFDKIKEDQKKENEKKKSTVKITHIQRRYYGQPETPAPAPKPVRYEHPIISYE